MDAVVFGGGDVSAPVKNGSSPRRGTQAGSLQWMVSRSRDPGPLSLGHAPTLGDDALFSRPQEAVHRQVSVPLDVGIRGPKTPPAVALEDCHRRGGEAAVAAVTPLPPGADVEAAGNGEGGGNCGPGAGLVSDAMEGHWHYSHRSPWLRALVLGANDGLVSIASLVLGVGAVNGDVRGMVVSGVAGLVAGAGSMAIGEFVSVFSQRDTELADIEKERQEHAKGPEAQARELEELAQIYVGRGLPYYLAKQVAIELSRVDVLKAHARDELGIDVDALSNPLQAALASAFAFSLGGGIPLLAGAFVVHSTIRLIVVAAVSSMALAMFGAAGARLGGAPMVRAALRVLVGGWLAMSLTYGVLKVLRTSGSV